ncbi:hypothetical protein PsYK624_052120 [Phanerochaete sordida]|uniref:Uncharacterized protein n=1 Tax=Phanerochaete sordida TaxID=48140 RepID=A0A9P3G4R1_9APHY|nr:hypothetical protein PsYK624_052120 [Phanerochaete sordida]
MSSVASSSAMGTPLASSSPGPNVEPSGPPPLLSSQASLYLYTFLVTLVLLLTVSGAIVTRSVVLRRRHRRLVEEAIRNGTYVPPASRTRRRLGEKPVLHDAFLGLGDPEDCVNEEKPGRASLIAAETGWEDIFPVSVQFVHRDGPRSCSSDADVTDRSAAAAALASPQSWRHRLVTVPIAFIIRAFGFPTSRNVPPAVVAAAVPTSAAEKIDSTTACALVSVIVAMPRPPSHKPAPRPPAGVPPPSLPGLSAHVLLPMDDDDSSEPLPPLEIGISAVSVEQWKEGDFQTILADRTRR